MHCNTSKRPHCVRRDASLEDQTFIEVEGSGTAPLLRRQNSLPPKYDDIFNQNNDSAPSAPPIQFDLVPIRTGAQRQNSNNSNRFSMI